jgi:hypothetical protein
MSTQCVDQDLARIKAKIDLFKSVLNQGPIYYLIQLFVSWMVTLEISNGSEKITVQAILLEFKKRCEQLDSCYDEFQFVVNNLHDGKNKEGANFDAIEEKIRVAKLDFRTKVYKLFDLNELLLLTIKKCVSLGSGINRVLPLLTDYFSKLTVQVVDSLLLTNSDVEFEDLMYTYFVERVESIKDPYLRKITKIKLINSMLQKAVLEKVEEPKQKENNTDLCGMIELNERNTKMSQ